MSLVLTGLTVLLPSAAWALTPRVPLPPGGAASPTCQDGGGARLEVKLVDDIGARATSGRLSLPPSPEAEALRTLVAGWGGAWWPLLDLEEDRVARLRLAASRRSGRAQPDLLAWAVVSLPGSDRGELEALGMALSGSPLVEHAGVVCLREPPPGDIAPPTADYSASQGYAGPDPGIDAEAAWALGADGDLVTLADVEYGWITSHEDLVDVGIQVEAGHTVPSWVADYGWDHHGTAVLGETSAPHNGYGVSGLVPGAKVRVYPEYSDQGGSRRASAITSAAADLAPGDVLLLEMQASGESGYGPAELAASVWTATRTAVDAGIVVVAAAGNGSQDLDSPWYQSSYLSRGDSGAIVVGAGTATTQHDRLGYSTHGARVDLQGWGTGVFTAGYGSHTSVGGDRNQSYTASFGGTSSASPIVAAAAVAVQSHALRLWGAPLDPEAVRGLLIATGTPQGSGANIGPLPDLAAALGALDADGDGALGLAWGGDDCDDADAAVGPAALEVWYDGLDADCDGASDFDADGDGHDAWIGGGADCDDTDPGVGPDAIDDAYDGADLDCDGLDADADGDGYASAAHGGLDCDDADGSVSPSAVEVWYDGVDSDCDGASDLDADGDGFDAAAHGGLDCDDADPAVHPGADDPAYDALDGDCDGETADGDGDGYASASWGGGDCDDADPATHPGAAEVWYDGQDQACDGGSDGDADGDGWDALAYGGEDCDDADAAVHPGAVDAAGDGADADCDGHAGPPDTAGAAPDGAADKRPEGCSASPVRGAGWAWLTLASAGLWWRRRG